MKKFLALLLSAIFLFSGNSFAESKINIFACEPEWGALAKEIGGEKVKIKNAILANEDPHHIKAKPSLIAAATKADLVFCSGADLEIGWLPLLIANGQKSIQEGNIGYFMASDYVNRLEIPNKLDRAMGDIHPSGNPHIHLNPQNIAIIAAKLNERLAQIDPQNKNYYQQNTESFTKKWQNLISKWQAQNADLKDMPIIVYHKNWSYLIKYLGLNEVASLEQTSGIAPSFSYLNELLKKVNSLKGAKNYPKAILVTSFNDQRFADWFSQKTGIKKVILPFSVDDENQNLEALFEAIFKELKNANR